MKNLFPYDEVRDQQDQLITQVETAVQDGGQLVVHAPTGLGKTAAALAPAVAYAQEHGKTVVFLTSRLTQHQLALDTVKAMNERHGAGIKVADLIGKRHYCLQPGANRLRSKEFLEYCKAMREDKACEYYENLKDGDQPSAKTKLALTELRSQYLSSDVKKGCETHGLCPYEVAVMLAKEAHVIVTDYNYLFNPGVADPFLQRIGKDLKDLIIVVDEAHNVPSRVKDSASDRLTTLMLQRAANEADKYGYEEHEKTMRRIAELFERLGLTIDERMEERYLDKEDILKRLDEPEQLIKDLEAAGDAIREEQQFSSLGAVADFLKTWSEGGDEGYTRIFSEESFRGETSHMLSYRCLDPSVVIGPIIGGAHATIMMSGTLSPTRMYKELLGALQAEEATLTSPFPEENRLLLVVPRTTTKYTMRGDAMYHEIAEHCAKICDAVPGNNAVFFPSYALLEEVKKRFEPRVRKTVFAERRGMSRDERVEFLTRFKSYKDSGAVLLGVISGSFGEGVDLPGDLLRGVVVVGLPLGKPDLETKALIKYFDNKYGRGWEYGYTFPAMNKTLQSAGRCIRTEQDRGVIVFLDERYDHAQYKACFPADWNIKTTILYEGLIKEFFHGRDR